MPLLKKALIRAYAAGTHKADVQLVDSLPTLIAGVPVATDIPAAEVIAGRECAVLFFTADNPDDGVVVTVHGALPGAPGGGPVTSIQDADATTRVETEKNPNEDKVRITVNATERGLFQTASPHVTLTGDAKVTGSLGVQVPPDTFDYITARNAGNIDDKIAIVADLGLASSNPGAGNLYGLAGQVIGKGLATSVQGLRFAAGYSFAGGTEALGIWIRTVWLSSSTFTLTRVVGLQIDPTQKSGTGTGTDAYAIWSKFAGINNFTNSIALRLEEVTLGTNKYLISAGGTAAAPNLRLDAGTPPNAALATEGDSPLFLTWMENGLLNFRRVRWKAAGAGGASLLAGDRVMLAV